MKFNRDQLVEGGVRGFEAFTVRLLYACNYYDGPLSGRCIVDGEEYWFELHKDHEICVPVEDDDDSFVRLRIFDLIKLTPEQEAQEKYWRDLFERHVGTHWLYDENNKKIGEMGPVESHHLFYDEYKDLEPIILTRDQMVGWFTEFAF